MNLNLSLKSIPARLLFLAITLAFCGFLMLTVINHFITGTLTDD